MNILELRYLESSREINVVRLQGCPHVGQGHGPIAGTSLASDPRLDSPYLSTHLNVHVPSAINLWRFILSTFKCL